MYLAMDMYMCVCYVHIHAHGWVDMHCMCVCVCVCVCAWECMQKTTSMEPSSTNSKKFLFYINVFFAGGETIMSLTLKYQQKK